MCSAAGVASPGTPFKAVERLEDLARPQAALAVLQARQGSSSGALPASHGLEAARIGMRLLLQCGLLPEAYAEVSCDSLPAAAFVRSGTLETLLERGTFRMQVSGCSSSLVARLTSQQIETSGEALPGNFQELQIDRHAACLAGWLLLQGELPGFRNGC